MLASEPSSSGRPKRPEEAAAAWSDWLKQARGARVVLLHQGAGSSIDHFLRIPLEQQGMTLKELNTAEPPERTSHEQLNEADLVVVVRYLPHPWLRLLRQRRRLGLPLAFLMDDDLLDPAALRDLPPAYRRRLEQKITRRRRWVGRLFDHLLVSSAPLAGKYAHLGAVQLPLQPHPSLLASTARLQLAYCGTSVHQQEFLWLVPLLEAVQRQHSHTHIDLFGDLTINRLFRHIPRLRIIHPLDWSRYRDATGEGRIDVLLCPLLESPFNHCRAPVKFIDAARSGAVGLYSDRPPYRGFIRDGVDGLLLPDDHPSWLKALNALVLAPARRQELARRGRERALALSRGEADPVGPGSQLAPDGPLHPQPSPRVGDR